MKKFRLLTSIFALTSLVATFGCSASSPTASSSQTASPPTSSQSAPIQEPAAAFPEKDITCVYFSAVGSGGDIFLRNLGAAIQPHMNGHNLVVENRVGASGGTAMVYVSGQAADGYTLMGTSTSIVMSSVLTDIPVKYDNFKYVCGMVYDPEYVYCRKDAPYNDIAELIEYAKAHPGEVSFGFPLASSSEALAQTVLIQESGIDAKTVVFEGGTECFTSLLGGHVDVSVGGYSDFKAQYETGEIKVLATLLDQPTEMLPDVKPLKDQGVDVVLEKIRGIIAPIDTPDEVVEQLCTLFQTAYENETFVNTLKADGCEVTFVKGDEVKASYDTIAAYAKEKLAA